MTSPPLGAYLRETTHSFVIPLYLCAGLLAVAFCLNLTIARLLKKKTSSRMPFVVRHVSDASVS
jgi:hypothetical protein